MLEAPDAETNLDVDELIRHLAKLDERAPIARDYTPGEVLDGLKNAHPQLFQEAVPRQDPDATASVAEPKQKRSRRITLRIMTAAAVVALALGMTSTALGFNPIKVFLEWADGIIQVYSNPSGVMELPAEDPSEYHSLEEALETNGISSVYLPTWVPKDYSLCFVDARGTADIVKFSASYEADRGDLLVRVTKFDDPLWLDTEEREDGGVTYHHSGIDYYIITNSDHCKAGWKVGNCSYVIDGHILEEELKEMIDSIL